MNRLWQRVARARSSCAGRAIRASSTTAASSTTRCRPFNALFGLGLWQSVRDPRQLRARRGSALTGEDTFEQWVTNRFGRRLYEIFFKTYTEKVWGIPCSEIRAEWAAQRIKGLSLPAAIRNALSCRRSGEVIKTLIEEFDYPRLRPGQDVGARSVTLVRARRRSASTSSSDVVAAAPRRRPGRREVVSRDRRRRRRDPPATHFISTMPLHGAGREARSAAAAAPCVAAARRLAYRDFLTVVPDRRPAATCSPTTGSTCTSPACRSAASRTSRTGARRWCRTPGTTSLGLEYFCNEGDELWTMADAALIALGAARDRGASGWRGAADVRDGCVVRAAEGVPGLRRRLRRAVSRRSRRGSAALANLQTIGRNGLHRYNNQDHSMLTALLRRRERRRRAARPVDVNTERSYHEEVRVPDPGADDDPGPVDILDATASLPRSERGTNARR